MATETTLAERSEQTDFGTQDTKLVRRGRKHVLIHDWWCGFGSLHGESLRPQEVDVPQQFVDAVAYALSNPDEPLGDELEHTQWNYFELHLLPKICAHNFYG